jgi:hypothetical protein
MGQEGMKINVREGGSRTIQPEKDAKQEEKSRDEKSGKGMPDRALDKK